MVTKDIKKRLPKLRDEIRRHEYLYYVENNPEISDYELNENLLTWTSGVKTDSPENNKVYAHYFPVEKDFYRCYILFVLI